MLRTAAGRPLYSNSFACASNTWLPAWHAGQKQIVSPAASFLISRSGSYLEAEHENETQGILDFELWNPSKFSWSAAESYNGQQGDVNMTVRQRHPLLSEINGCCDEATVEGKAQTKSHYRYYLK